MRGARRSERKTQNRVINLLARYAATDLARLTVAEVLVLQGGTLAWMEAGLPQEQGETHLALTRTDRYRRPYEGTDNPRAAMQGYLDYEYGLVRSWVAMARMVSM